MQIPKDLVLRLQQGEKSAQHQFWESEFGPVLAICTHVLGPGPVSVDIATDLLNDFMFRYVHDLRNLHGGWPYLKLMAIRRSVRERQRAMTNNEFNEQTIPETDSSVQHMEVAALLPRLQHCLETLTPKAQSALRLKYRKGLSNEQIGQIIGGSKQYMGRLFQKSLQLLRECLNKQAAVNG